MIDRDVEARMDAYRGNPQALAQKYAVGQELLDLIALQKLKSEKESAMRDMQLQMAQQGKPPTIAQRREAEVLGMTKDEILQQQGGIMKQKQDAQQKALEELAAQRNPAAGIPTLPTPEVMPEAAMAAGGIVAFAGGGGTWDKKKTPYDELIEREARRRGIDPVVFKRLIGSESSFNEFAISPRGEKYGVGIAQIADVHGMSKEDRLNPNKAIPAAAEIFSKYLERADGDYAKALQMYKGASTEGGKKRMAGPIQRILEGVTDVLVPTARAGEVQTRGVGQPTKKAVAPAEEEAAYDPMTGIRITGPEATPYKPKAREENRLPPGTEYDPITEGIRSGIGQATGAVQGFFQGRPEAATPTPPASPTSIPYPVPGVPNEERKSIPYPENAQELVTRGVSPTAPPDAQPSQPPAPAAPQASGLASILPPEYQGLAKKQIGAVESQLGTDPEAMAKARAEEYENLYGKDVKAEAALARARLEDRLKRQAEIRQAEKDRRITEALLGAQGATWQEALGSAGRAGLASIRRGEAEELKQLEAEDVARRGLADVGLGVKKGVLEARGTGRKEGIEALQKGATEAGLAVRGAMTAETQRDITAAQLEANKIAEKTRQDTLRVQNEAQRQIRIEAGRTAAHGALGVLKEKIKILTKAYTDAMLLDPNKASTIQTQIDIVEKLLKLEQDKINSRFDSMLSGGSSAVDGTSGYGPLETIKK